jgi:hypothetical protein
LLKNKTTRRKKMSRIKISELQANDVSSISDMSDNDCMGIIGGEVIIIIIIIED